MHLSLLLSWHYGTQTCPENEHLHRSLHRPLQPQITSRFVGNCLRPLDRKNLPFSVNQKSSIGLNTTLIGSGRVSDLCTTAKPRFNCSLMTFDIGEGLSCDTTLDFMCISIPNSSYVPAEVVPLTPFQTETRYFSTNTISASVTDWFSPNPQNLQCIEVDCTWLQLNSSRWYEENHLQLVLGP